MSLLRGSKVTRGYATVEDGENYRLIATVMSDLGFQMNHSSARNGVLRSMKCFASALAPALGYPTDEASIARLARSPEFQGGVGDLLAKLKHVRR